MKLAKIALLLFLGILSINHTFSQTTIVNYNFNSGDEGWTNTGTNNWVRGDSDFSTGADGNYWGFPNTGLGYAASQSALAQSPVIDLTGYYQLTLSMDIRYNTEDAWDGFNVEYSDDGGTSWFVLGSTTEGTNWYNDGDVDAIGNGVDGWSDDNGAWQTASISLPLVLVNNNNARFRVQFASDGSNEEVGVAFDNFKIRGTLISTQYASPSGSGVPGDATETVLLWLRADSSVVEDGTNVYGWGDWSGNGTHANLGETPTLTSNAVNGYNAITFDGVDDYLDAGDVLDLTPSTDEWSVFSVFNVGVGNTGTIISRAGPTDVDRQYQFGVTGNNYFQIIGGGGTQQGTATVTGQWNIGSSVVSSTDVDSWAAGASDVSNGTIGTDTETENVIIGARDNGTGFPLDGDLAEVIMFYGAVSDSKRRDIETYLAIKYGITLNIGTQDYTVNGSSIFDNTNFSAYNNDIAGIGRDDSQSLNQTTSKSSSGNIVEMSNASSLGDGDFMVWGSNGGATTTTTANVPAGISNRLTRIWRVSETNDVGTVDISFDLTTLGLSGRIYNLITAGSGASMPTGLSSGTVSTEGVVSSVNGRDYVTFSGVTINDQEYFTLAVSDAPAPGDQSTNLQVWLRADAGVTQSSNSVSSWADQSGNGNDATEATATEQPFYVSDDLNGNPMILFDGINDRLDGTGFYSHDIYIVVDPVQNYNSTSGDDAILGLNSTDFYGIFFGSHTTNLTDEVLTYSDNTGTYRSGVTGTTITYKDPMIINFRVNAGATNQELFIDGAGITTSVSGTFGTLSNVAYTLGVRGSGGADFLDGAIGEIVNYSARLSDANRRDVTSYLALKYGITLDITSQNYTVGGTSIYNNTSYPNDIAGIGRDDSQGLFQTSSQSVSGQIVRVSNASSLGDGDYFVWGNDGGAFTFTTSNVPAGVNERLTRIWRADETNDVGTIDISFDVGAMGFGTNANYSLIVASSGATMPADLSTGTVTGSPTISGSVITFSGVTINDGEYFTLGVDVDPTAHPGDVSTNLSLWLNAGSGVTQSSGSVSKWADLSGGINHAKQLDASEQPTVTTGGINGNDVITFDGSDLLAGEGGFSTREYFVVLQPDAIYNSGSASGTVLGFQEGQYARLGLGPTSGSITNEVITHAAGNGAEANYRAALVSTTTDLNQIALVNFRENAGATGEELYYNGALITTDFQTSGTYEAYDDATYDVGDEEGATPQDPYNGTIGEIISYSSRLTDSQRRDVATYLAIKYGLTLDITSQNYTVGGASIYSATSYSNDIAGIGYDISMNLNQTSSKSVNTGSIVRMENASDLEDGEYLVWGNNGGTNTFSTTNVPPGNTEIYDKVWTVDMTGGDGVGTVSVSFDVTSLGFDMDNSTLNLITMASGNVVPDDFDTQGVVNSSGVISTVNGRTLVTFDNVTFSDGDFFTFGGDIQTTAPGSNVALWLRADKGVTTSGSQVSAWIDQSGNGNDVSQGTSTLQPSFSNNEINYNDALYFSSDNIEGIGGFHTHEYFVVLKPDNTISNTLANGYVLGFETGATTGFYVGDENIIGNDLFGQTLDTDAYDAAATSASISNDDVIVFNVRNNAGATAYEMYANGTSFAVSSNGTFANISDNPLRIGNSFNNDAAFEGYVSEVISYSAAQTTAVRRDIESYLALKYGVTLDITSENYTADGTSIYAYGTHSNDIAGIGKHLDFGLNQTQSISQNSGAIIKVEGASDLDDNEYFIWGNDGGSKTTTQTSELASGYEERLPAEWRVDITGDPGTVTVKIYIGGIANIDEKPQSASLYELLIDANGNFNVIDGSVAASTLSNDTLTFNNVSISDGQYFTLALPAAPDVTGMTLWLKADEGIEEASSNVAENNDLVEFWRDQSGNNNDFDQGTFARRPTFLTSQLNGNPLINFNTGYTYLDLASTNLNPRSIFVVYRDVATAQYTTPFTNDDGDGIGHGHSDDTQLFNATFTPADVRNGDNYVNGTDIGDGTAQARPDNFELHSRTFVSNLSNAAHNYYVGVDRATNDRSIDGDIGEIMVYTSALSNAARRDVETYLAIKYGITLDITSLNYTYNSGTSIYSLTSYANDIAGLGANSTFGLSQTSSQSINSDAIVTMSNASSLNNNDFLVWGNDNGATTETTTTTPPGIGNRMTRIWGVTETNDIGTVTVTMDLTGLGYGAKSLTDFTLILDTDADFSNGTLRSYTPDSYTSDVLTFTGVDFTSATNFGLGTTIDLATDTDTDGIPDYFESSYGTDYNNSDDPVAGGAGGTDTNAATGTNGDGISDALENILIANGATAPVTVLTDTDGDGIPDHIEVDNGTNPFSANAPTSNGNSDSDNDGIPNALEVLINNEGGPADPDLTTDTDSDGIPDYYEVMNGTNPNDVNDPTASGGSDGDADGISDAMEAILVSGGATAPIGTGTDTDGDGIPDYIEAQTFTDPFNGASPTAAGTPSVRSLQADYVASGGSCTNVSGYQWMDITDNLGNLVFSINPVGNNLGSTCWGVRILDGAANVRDDGTDWILNRNWYITPSVQPASVVYVRFYSLNSENTDLHTELGNDGQSPGTISNFNADSIKITKISGVDNLNPFVTGGTRTLHNPVVADYSTTGKTYTIGITSFSGFTPHFNPGDPDTPLPVELIRFEAKAETNGIKLSWATASELNNDYFVIERSLDGEQFEVIGEVDGNGTTSELQEYLFVDGQPVTGVSYYRLKQVDYDGTADYSDLVAVNYYNNLGLKVLVYPNPARDVVNISLENDVNVQIVSGMLVDPSGRRMNIQLTKEGARYVMNTDGVNNGLYILQLNIDGQVLQHRIKIMK